MDVIDILNLVLGGVLGFLICWFFEKRAMKEARVKAQEGEERSKILEQKVIELTDELKKLRENILSGKRDLVTFNIETPDKRNLEQQILEKAKELQNASGKVPESTLRSHFVGLAENKDMDVAISVLTAEGKISVKNKEIGLL
jgi:flagellar biosynthesis/type III secretory pathway M-ring protein FliF/YscJ